MLRHRDLVGLISAVVLVGAVFVGSLVLEIIDRLTESAAMRRRVNSRSDQFLQERGSAWQAASRAASQFLAQFSRRRF